MLKTLNRLIRTVVILTLGVAAAAPALPTPDLAADAVKDVLISMAPAPAVPAPMQAAAPQPAAQPTAAQVAAQNRAAAIAQASRAAAAPARAPAPTPVRAATPAPARTVTTRAAPTTAPLAQAPVRTGRTAVVRATAYNSLPGQTDSSPFITATGTRVRPGVVALSRDLLRSFPYGSRIMLEDLSGRYNSMLKGRIFIVEDTMAARKTNSLDIWMGTRSQAIQFGARTLRITAVR